MFDFFRRGLLFFLHSIRRLFVPASYRRRSRDRVWRYSAQTPPPLRSVYTDQNETLPVANIRLRTQPPFTRNRIPITVNDNLLLLLRAVLRGII